MSPLVDGIKRLAKYGVGLAILVGIIIGLYGVFDFKEPEVVNQMTPFPPLLSVSKTILKMPVGVTSRIPVKGEMQIIYKDKQESYGIEASKRGASSYFFDKPQFSITILDKEGLQTRAKIMDMPKGEDWVLNGPYIDRTMIRNYLAYAVAFDVMGYAPRLQFTELYHDVGGVLSYRGLYTWTEKIKRGEDRVKISASLQGQAETSFIIKRDRYREGDILLKVYGKELYMTPNEVLAVYPRVNLTSQQINYMEDHVSLLERNIYHDHYDIDQLGYDAFIEIDTFVDYVILNEFFMNTDAGSVSTYFYKDARSKLMAGPVWDFNNAMGNVNSVFRMYDAKGFFMHQRVWFDRLLQDKKFVERLITRYKALRLTTLSDDALQERIDLAAKIIQPYAERDEALYAKKQVNDAYYDFLGTSYPLLTQHLEKVLIDDHAYEAEVQRLKTFVKLRGEWLDQNIESLEKWVD